MTVVDRVETVRSILATLYALPEELPRSGINRIERETIFFLYENTDHKLAARRPHSLKARQIRDGKTGLNRILTYDHAIPLGTLRAGLRAAVSSRSDLEAFLRRYVRSAIITRDENDHLNARYKSTMPEGSLPDDAMARYRAVGIAFGDDDKRLLLEP